MCCMIRVRHIMYYSSSIELWHFDIKVFHIDPDDKSSDILLLTVYTSKHVLHQDLVHIVHCSNSC